jgi:phage tail-like protein
MTTMGVPPGLLPSVSGGWIPGVSALQPYQAFNFAVEIEGLLVGGFTEVSGLEGEVEIEEYREGGVNGYVHRLPGGARYPSLVLSHGLTAMSTLWNWYHETTQGAIQRRNGTVMLLDTRQVPVMWWNFRNAVPVRWTGPAFNAGSDEVGVESLELAHEGLTRPVLSHAVALAGEVARLARPNGADVR